MKSKTVAIANRGEIAKRIIITCREMGLKSVLLHAAGDIENEAFRLADKTLCIGPAKESYLNIEANVEGALAAGAFGLHPGYGFLSETPLFAKECEKKGLVFIGPSSRTMDCFSDKIKTKELCEKVGLPVLPAQSGFQTKAEVLKAAHRIGWPLMIKASRSGGGQGLKLVHNKEELSEYLKQAKGLFHKESFFLEKYLSEAKHIEVQVFVDTLGKIFVLGDRDCSIQRRHQKIIEEAPSGLSKKLKNQIKEAVVSLFQLAEYQGPGTVEFLVDKDNFFLLEINPRLQVEHTVTEMIFGLDLVRAQILTALKKPAFFKSEDLKSKGHSIQCRICCEDSHFFPSSGRLSCLWPSGFGKRVDTGFGTGDRISTDYDSLIAKMIVWDSSRVRAIEKMRSALSESLVFGCFVNIPFLQHILHLPEFLENKITVDFIEKNYPKGLSQKPLPFEEEFLMEIYKETKSGNQNVKDNRISSFNPWFSKK